MKGLHVVWALLPALAFTACAGDPDPTPPSPSELANATYRGLNLEEEAITLEAGSWEGVPFAEGGATRPTVSLLDAPPLTGDLNGDGRAEAIALLTAWPGGTGKFLHLAVMTRGRRGLEQLAVTRLGDRVQVRDAKIQGERILLDLVVGGPRDAACCPGDLVRREWVLSDRGVLEQVEESSQGRLTPGVLAGAEWTLTGWAYGDPAPEEPRVTLRFEEGQFVGRGGCNQYFVEIVRGATPAEITLGPVGSTRMTCPEPAGEVEARFLGSLERVTGFSFLGTRLVLTYEDEGALKGLIFERRPAGA
jgi:heat shock protein HslJ